MGYQVHSPPLASILGVHGIEFLGAIPWSDGQALVGGICRRVLPLGAAEQNLLSSAQACEVERAKENRESITAGSQNPEKCMRCQEKLPCGHPWPRVPDSGEWDKVLVEEAQRRRRGWKVKAQAAGQLTLLKVTWCTRVKKPMANGNWPPLEKQRVVCWSHPEDTLMLRGQRLALCAHMCPLAASGWELRLLQRRAQFAHPHSSVSVGYTE